eukprot:gb/GEZN01011517.1/.p1 GENE.gb/GEZN01011517.1/~~gb/GEZN01011517.1/.p1  ORF type:complete len:260 (-),score=40.32 gb/GEZN01011517.1/:235-1014(-)
MSEQPKSKKQKTEVEMAAPVEVKGKWALITGSGSGVGEAIAQAYAAKGINLVLVGRAKDKLEKVAASCKTAYPAGQYRIETCDLTDGKQADSLVKKLLEDKVPIDILVNNAGMLAHGNPQEGQPDEWDVMMALNLLTPMRLTRLLAPHMVSRGWGVVVNIGSIAGTEPMSTSGAYAASKYGLRGWSLSSWANLRTKNVKVCLINPAFINTPMVAGQPNVLPQRMLQPTDVAQAALLPLITNSSCVPREITLHLTLSAYQ